MRRLDIRIMPHGEIHYVDSSIGFSLWSLGLNLEPGQWRVSSLESELVMERQELRCIGAEGHDGYKLG